MDFTVTGNLTVDGRSTMTGMITCRSDSFFTGFLRVGALAAVGFNVLEFAQVNQTLNVLGETTLRGTASITGNTVLAGDLTVNGVNGILSQGPVIVDDIIRTNPPNGIICGGQLHVAGDAFLQTNLNVAGISSFQTGVLAPLPIRNISISDANSGSLFNFGFSTGSVGIELFAVAFGSYFHFYNPGSVGATQTERYLYLGSGNSDRIVALNNNNQRISGTRLSSYTPGTFVTMVYMPGNAGFNYWVATSPTGANMFSLS